MVQVAEAGGTQTAARAAQARMDQRLDDLAERVAQGDLLHHAGREMGLTKGQTARAWNMIKTGLGSQAS